MQAAMGSITGVVLAAFLAYGAAWYSGAVEGNFSLLLFLATAVTGVYWVAERLVFLPQRRRAAQRLLAEHDQRKAALEKQGFSQIEGDIESARQKVLAQPWWLDWTAGLFPVILAVFLLRSFLFEPFKIPFGLDDPDAARGRPDPGQQVSLRRPAAGAQHQGLEQPFPTAR